MESEEFLATRSVWDQQLVSENARVYRSEWLAWQMLGAEYRMARRRLETIHTVMAPRYTEGYTKGVHDEDALNMLAAILPVHRTLGLLRFGPRVRALALLFWESHRAPMTGEQLEP